MALRGHKQVRSRRDMILGGIAIVAFALTGFVFYSQIYVPAQDVVVYSPAEDTAMTELVTTPIVTGTSDTMDKPSQPAATEQAVSPQTVLDHPVVDRLRYYTTDIKVGQLEPGNPDVFRYPTPTAE